MSKLRFSEIGGDAAVAVVVVCDVDRRFCAILYGSLFGDLGFFWGHRRPLFHN